MKKRNANETNEAEFEWIESDTHNSVRKRLIVQNNSASRFVFTLRVKGECSKFRVN